MVERSRKERDVLFAWAGRVGRIVIGVHYLSRVTGGGAEHRVFFDQASQRYFKITRGFGLTVGTGLLIGKKTQRWFGTPFVREATPLEYLERIHLFNAVFGDDIRLEGVIAESQDEAIVTSQPVVRGRATTNKEIGTFMATLRFHRVEGVVAGRHDSISYFRTADGVAVFDTHGENFLADGDRVAPIDALIITANADLRRLLELSPEERRAEVGLWKSLIRGG